MAEDRIRRRLVVSGVVQGVGFRPFVYALASKLGLSGSVGNDSGGVTIEVEGPAAAVSEFRHRLSTEAPPLARIDAVTVERLNVHGGTGFDIMESQAGAGRTLVSPDIATCDDCLAELADPSDRRYRHPFISCTNCGPRFTIITGCPYDRPATTMAAFPMCAGLRGRVRRPGRPPVPRPDGRLPRLRSDADAAPPGGRRIPAGRGHAPRRARLLAGGAVWRSRGSAAITWPVTPGRRPRSARCASARTGATSRSRSWSPTRHGAPGSP